MAVVIDPLSWTKISSSVGQLVPIKTRKPNLAKPCLSTAGCVAEWCWYIEYQHPMDIWEYIESPIEMWIQLANGCNHHSIIPVGNGNWYGIWIQWWFHQPSWGFHGTLDNLITLQSLAEPYLVGGIPTPLKNMSSSVWMIIPNMYIYIWKKHVPNHQPNIEHGLSLVRWSSYLKKWRFSR